MAFKPLRLLHAANLNLDSPLRGTGVVVDEIREVTDIATILAFDRIVSTAIDKDVDALLITGNSFDAKFPSLAAEVALRQGLDRLAEKRIPVFVTPGQTDPADSWLGLPRLPSNVTLFTHVDEEPVDLTDHDHLLATILPVRSDSSVDPEELSNILSGRRIAKGDRPFVIGMLLPEQSVLPRERSRLNPNRFAALDWLVCGSDTESDLLPLTDGLIHAQHAPQGLTQDAIGAHGITLLEVDGQRITKQNLIPVAPVRWERFVQPVDQVRTRDALLERMLAQLERLPSFKGELVRIVNWKLDRTSGDANGWELESSVNELCEALTELTDQPDGLRYVHRIHPLEPDLTLVEPAYREVLTEYLLALKRRPSANQANFNKWVADARVTDLLTSNHWEQWTNTITPEQISERAQQLGWKWFASIGKK